MALPPEDAGVLALATFGTDRDVSILGMHVVATFDQPMIAQWAAQHAVIQTHFDSMWQDLPSAPRGSRGLFPCHLHRLWPKVWQKFLKLPVHFLV